MYDKAGIEERVDTAGRIDWHQTKGLSISIIILLIVNIVSTVWWAATLTSDVGQNSDVVELIPKVLERVIILEAITGEYKDILTRFLGTLDKMDATVTRIDREQAKRTNSIHIHTKE